MIKSVININYIAILLLLLSCHSNKEIKFKETEVLNGEVVPINEIHRMFFMHKSDKYLLLSGSDVNNNTLHIYSIPQLKYLGSNLAKGNAANEVTRPISFCTSNKSEDLVYVYALKPFQLNGISIEQPNKISILDTVSLKLNASLNSIHYIDDRYVIYFDAMETGIYKYDTQQNEIVDKIIFDSEIKGSDNPNMGILAANSEYVVFAYEKKKQISIYSTKTFKLKTTITQRNNENSAIQYYNVVATDNKFYAFCRGNKVDNKLTNAHIETYDYDGNPIKLYVLSHPTVRCVIDESNGFIYGYEFGKDNNNFVRYNFHNDNN